MNITNYDVNFDMTEKINNMRNAMVHSVNVNMHTGDVNNLYFTNMLYLIVRDEADQMYFEMRFMHGNK